MDEEFGYQLTVITVCLNVLQDLKKTVDSVLRQKEKGTIRIEHLIVDGASHDGTPEWLRQQKEEGKIEDFVSEPDAGIYNAMNKGIARAHGHVLAFLNAGDYYADEDISCCVMPIVEGRVHTTCAVAAICHSSGKIHHYFIPNNSYPSLSMPFSHQAFFASAEAYAAVGGYDETHFRSASDFDMINAMTNKFGFPLILQNMVVHFALGGFSTDSLTTLRHEVVEIHYKSWPQIFSRCKSDASYQLTTLVMLSSHVVTFAHWNKQKVLEHGEALSKLGKMLGEFPTEGLSARHARYLKWLEQAVMPKLEKQGRISCIKRCELDIRHMRCAPTWRLRLSPVLSPSQKRLLKGLIGD